MERLAYGKPRGTHCRSCPAGTMLAVERAAVEARLRPSELVRRLLLDGLAASGFDLPGAVRCSEPVR
jgi:hypothetical protein